MNHTEKQHRGEILEDLVRKSPYPISVIAHKLKISRSTLYNKFRDPYVGYDFILVVGDLLNYDVKSLIPTIETRVTVSLEQQQQQIHMRERQYLELLERYKKLFTFLTKVSHQYGINIIKDDLNQLS